MSNFILDTSILGGADFNYAETPIEGRGRSIALELTQATNQTDFEVFGYSVRFAPGEEDARE